MSKLDWSVLLVTVVIGAYFKPKKSRFDIPGAKQHIVASVISMYRNKDRPWDVFLELYKLFLIYYDEKDAYNLVLQAFESVSEFTPQSEAPSDYGVRSILTRLREFVDQTKDGTDLMSASKLGKLTRWSVVVIGCKFLGLRPHKQGFLRMFDMKFWEKDSVSMTPIDVVDCMLSFFESGYSFFVDGKTIPESIIADDRFTRFYAEYMYCMDVSNQKNEPHLIFMDRLAKATVVSELLAKHHPQIIKLSVDLRKLHAEKMSFVEAQKPRDMPLGIMLEGPPGVGKSELCKLLFKQYSVLDETAPYNPDAPHESQYLRNPFSDFWDGYLAQWGIILDDMGALKPERGVVDAAMKEFLQILNTQPYVPNQASLDLKGLTPLQARLVLVSTNIRQAGLDSYFRCTDAPLRRMPLQIFVTAPNQSESGISTTGNSFDVWRFEIRKLYMEQGVLKRKILESDCDIARLLQIFSSEVRHHLTLNTQAVERGHVLAHSKQCASCGNIDICCACQTLFEPQEEDIRNVFIEFFITSPLMFFAWFLELVPGNYFDLPMRNLSLYALVVCSAHGYYSSALAKVVALYHNRSIYRFWKDREIYIGALFLLATAVTASYFLTETWEPQGSAFTKPVGNDEKENPWIPNHVKVSFLPSRTEIGVQLHDLVNIVKRSSMRAFRLDKNTSTQGLCIGDQWYLFAGHTMDGIEGQTLNVRFGEHTKQNLDRLVKVSKHNVKRLEKDLVLIRFPNMPPGKDLRKYFAPAHDPLGKGVLVIRDRELNVSECDVTPFSHRFTHFGDSSEKIAYQTPFKTYSGLCGAILVALVNGAPKIVGIHVAGNNSNANVYVGASVHIYASDIDLFDSFVSQGEFDFGSHILQPLHHKSVFNWIDGGFGQVYGSFTAGRRTMSSKVKPSMAASILENFGITSTKVPPVLKGWLPWRLAAIPALNPSTLDFDLLHDVVDAMIDEVDESSLDFSSIHKIDLNSAVNGVAGVRFIDSINKSSSAGFPYNRSKNAGFLIPNPTVEHPDGVDIASCIAKDMSRVITSYQAGERANPIFRGSLKDEPVSVEKAKSGKTRVFDGAPFGWCLVVRMYLLMFTRFFQLNSVFFHNAVGITVTSEDWAKFRSYISRFGESNCFGLDYSKFDKKMCASTLLEAFRFIIYVCKKSGNYDAEDIKVLEAMKFDFSFPLVEYNGDLVMFNGTNPSGNPLTVVLNCIVNQIYIRYCYFKIFGVHKGFKKYVSLLTYGDDLIASCKFWDRMNHITIKEILAIENIEITMPNKTDTPCPTQHIDSLDFLKRLFKEENGHVFCPLDRESIDNMLTVIVESKSVPEQKQIADIIGAVQFEAFQHGREVFDHYTRACEDVVVKLRLHALLSVPILPYEYFFDTIVRGLSKKEVREKYKSYWNSILSFDDSDSSENWTPQASFFIDDEMWEPQFEVPPSLTYESFEECITHCVEEREFREREFYHHFGSDELIIPPANYRSVLDDYEYDEIVSFVVEDNWPDMLPPTYWDFTSHEVDPPSNHQPIDLSPLFPHLADDSASVNSEDLVGVEIIYEEYYEYHSDYNDPIAEPFEPTDAVNFVRDEQALKQWEIFGDVLEENSLSQTWALFYNMIHHMPKVGTDPAIIELSQFFFDPPSLRDVYDRFNVLGQTSYLRLVKVFELYPRGDETIYLELINASLLIAYDIIDREDNRAAVPTDIILDRGVSTVDSFGQYIASLYMIDPLWTGPKFDNLFCIYCLQQYLYTEHYFDLESKMLCLFRKTEQAMLRHGVEDWPVAYVSMPR